MAHFKISRTGGTCAVATQRRFVEFLAGLTGRRSNLDNPNIVTVGVAVASPALLRVIVSGTNIAADGIAWPVVFAPAELNACGEVIRDVGWPEIAFT